MRFDLDKYVSLHEQGVYVRARRTEMIAANIANADTPNYKSKDFDFRSVLEHVADTGSASQLQMTSPKHIQPGGRSAHDAEAKYRYPLQASLDGNTVDPQMEKAEFSRNALEYRAAMDFLGGQFKGLTAAIKGRSQ